MKNYSRHLLSLGALLVFALLAVSSKVSQVSFVSGTPVEGPTSNCLIKTNGSKVYGKKISWNEIFHSRKFVYVDGQRFPTSEVRGFFVAGVYYGRIGNDYLMRIVRGKINVYVSQTPLTNNVSTNRGVVTTYQATSDAYFAQIGEDGPVVPLKRKSDVRKTLEGCPLAEQMLDKKDANGGSNARFFNHLYEVYNAGCRDDADTDSTMMMLR